MSKKAETRNKAPLMEQATPVTHYVGSKPPVLCYETEGGLRYTPEQWQLRIFQMDLEEKLDRVIALLETKK